MRLTIKPFLVFGNMDVPSESYFINSFQRWIRSVSVQIFRIFLLTYWCDFNVGEGGVLMRNQLSWVL